jgi:plastocyanin
VRRGTGAGSLAALVGAAALPLLTAAAAAVPLLTAAAAGDLPDAPAAPPAPVPATQHSATTGIPSDSVEDVAPASEAVHAVLGEYTVALAPARVTAGRVRFLVTNAGTTFHNLHVSGAGVDAATAPLRAGESAELDLELAGPGEYAVICSLRFHAGAGMGARLIVE